MTDYLWALVLGAVVMLTAAGAAVEHRGLTDGKPGGTISEWAHEHLPPWLVWLALPLLGAWLAWHFTVGKGHRWWPGRDPVSRNQEDDPAVPR